MPQAPSNEEDTNVGIDSETTRFNADAHQNFVHTTFEEFRSLVDHTAWVVCQIADNTATNKKMACMTKTKHISCKSHLVNLDVNNMIKDDAAQSKVIDQVHETMLSIKSKLTNAALLRNITDFKPVTHNEALWSGKCVAVWKH